MIEFTGTFNQVIKGQHSAMGGALVVFEGHPQLLVGGFNYNLDDLPPAGAVLPCGTPVYCDEALRTITPVITAKVTGVNTTKITVADNGFGQCPFKVGDSVGELPATLTSAASYYATVTAVDGNEVTVSEAITGLTNGEILAVLDGTSHKVKAIPNAITPYDICRSADAIAVDGEGMIGNDRPLLERRMPPYNDALKAAVQANGHKLTFSNRK